MLNDFFSVTKLMSIGARIQTSWSDSRVHALNYYAQFPPSHTMFPKVPDKFITCICSEMSCGFTWPGVTIHTAYAKQSAVIKPILGFLCFHLIICFPLHNSFVRLILLVTLVNVEKMRLKGVK